MKTKTQKIVQAALLAALTCALTMIIKVPSPLKGYMNLGDALVIVSGCVLSPFYAFLSAGVGSALADLFSGYVTYVPATFVIKGIMAIAAGFLFRLCKGKMNETVSYIIGGFCAEIIMIVGYLTFESFLYGFVPSLVNIPSNLMQGGFGIVVSLLLMKVFSRIKKF